MNDVRCCVFHFVLYPDTDRYGLQGVLEGLSRDLIDFRCYEHSCNDSGEPCRVHYHCIGRSVMPKRRAYYAGKYNIPLSCIFDPLAGMHSDKLYDDSLEYIILNGLGVPYVFE